MKKTKKFEDEPKLPKLNNITSHVSNCKEKKKHDEREEAKSRTKPGAPLVDQINLRQASSMMADWLKGGELDPEVAVTQKGFLRIFSAWILDESLPWTTGEAPTLRLLFQYMRVSFQLPSDTTVRNQLAKIFAELHGKVVRKFSVSA